MIKSLLLSFLTLSLLSASVIKPTIEIKIDGNAKDIIQKGDNLYIASDGGKVLTYDIEKQKIVKEISIPTIKDFMGDVIPAKIFSVDFMDGRYMFLSDSGQGGYSNLWIHEDNKTKKIITPKYKGAIIKARLIDKTHALLGFLGDEAALYDLESKKTIYRVQLDPSKFSDFALNEDKTKAAYGCESGAITVIDVKSGKVIKKLKGINKDNVYKVAFKKGVITGAGQDRRGSFYDLSSGKGDFFEGSFLIYATALSPSAKRAAFAMDENNDITVYDLSTKAKVATLKGQKSTLNSIIFKDEDTIFSASDDDTVMMWKLK
jgi:WD40 repeat protein